MRNLLVVDDDRVTRHLLITVLKRAGFSVAGAANGAAALDRLRRKEYDLVLLDVWMPRFNGLEVLARMREEGMGVKAIVMTSDNTSGTVLRAIREQAYSYLSKPVDPEQVVEVVKAALEASAVPPIEVLSARRDWVELLVPCDMNTSERIQAFLSRMDADLPEDVRTSVGHVFHEMLMNAIEWGGKLDPNLKVRISYLRARRMLLYRIADPGPGFKFEELAHAAVSYPPERVAESAVVRERLGVRPGGFGILLSRELVDELLYNEAHNEVVFVKYLD